MSLKLRVKITDTSVTTRSGVAKASGKPYEMRIQESAFIKLGLETRRMPINLNDGRAPYPAGEYEIDIEPHLTLSRFDQLEFRPFADYVLMPVVAAFGKTANG